MSKPKATKVTVSGPDGEESFDLSAESYSDILARVRQSVEDSQRGHGTATSTYGNTEWHGAEWSEGGPASVA